jgi:hypothetical protein
MLSHDQEIKNTDGILKRFSNVSAAVLCAFIYMDGTHQGEYSREWNRLQDNAQSLCAESQRKITGGEKESSALERQFIQAGTFQEACVRSIREVPERTPLGPLYDTGIASSGVATVLSFGLWAAHRRRHSWLGNDSGPQSRL